MEQPFQIKQTGLARNGLMRSGHAKLLQSLDTFSALHLCIAELAAIFFLGYILSTINIICLLKVLHLIKREPGRSLVASYMNLQYGIKFEKDKIPIPS